MAGYVSELAPALGVPHGYEATMQVGERAIVDGYADVARFVVSPWREGLRVEVNPRLGIDPDIEEWTASPFWRRFPFSERLRLLEVFVSAEIATYEYDCTGRSRSAGVLTDTYKADSDSRRASITRRPTRTRKEVVWSDPLPRTSATPSELAGEDFPPDGPGLLRPG